MMMKKVSWRISGIMSPLTIACCLLASGSLAWADSGEGYCANRTLQGDYGFAIEGLILPSPGVALPIRGVNMTHYDGDGKSTQVDHIISNGAPISPIDWPPSTGTYHVNADCTGTAQINQVGGVLNLRIVVVRNGKEIHAVVTAPFNGPARTVSSIGIKVE
jgi:hypothetical protein